MTHGSLTPLGKQLRHVILGIGRKQSSTQRTTLTRRYATTQVHRSPFTLSPRKLYSAAATAAVEPEAPNSEDVEDEIQNEELAWFKERKGIARIAHNLKASAQSNATDAFLLRRRQNKVDYPYASADGTQFRAEYKPEADDHAWVQALCSEHIGSSTLTGLLASYSRHKSKPRSGDRDDHSWLTSGDHELLRRYNCDKEDLAVWMDIVCDADSSHAGETLLAHTRIRGSHAVPLPILEQFLRRHYVSPSALRSIIVYASAIEYDGRGAVSPRDSGFFTIFDRLTYHAREAWPEALPSLATLLLQHLPSFEPHAGINTTRASVVDLNRAMRLLSLPSVLSPFKSNKHQENAILLILRYMADRTPSLHINREGYRAVVRLQLAQKKTEKEQQWAALKALSWPPWKEDRNRMDANIGPEDGVSLAGDTLRRMREAGYPPETWERVAEIYAGWDTDHTPTIQRRALLALENDQCAERTVWGARIAATRTVQEAWACYEAYEEETGGRPYTDVLLAVLEKLLEGEKRQHPARLSQPTVIEGGKMLAGDVREVEPLPPSTHLETFTRAPPPTVEGFVRRLRNRKIFLRGRSLAFIVQNAPTLQRGLDYIRASERVDHHGNPIRSRSYAKPLLYPSRQADYKSVPAVLLHAFITLLCRFSNVPLKEALSAEWRELRIKQLEDGRNSIFNPRHAIVHSIWLLQKPRDSTYLHSWNAVLQALAKEQSFKSMHLATTQHENNVLYSSPATRDSMGAITAWQLGKKAVIDTLRHRHFHLDAEGVLYLTLIMENAAIASWQILRERKGHEGADVSLSRSSQEEDSVVDIIRNIVSPKHHRHMLQHHFDNLIGQNFTNALPSQGHRAELELPSMLITPNPALLHAYVRALGWLGSYESLRRLARFLVQYNVELAARQALDRNGDVVMRRAIIAIRVFAERSWLDTDSSSWDARLPTGKRLGEGAMLAHLESKMPDKQLNEIKDMIESVEGWGGWPSDKEVREYCRYGRDKFGRVRGDHSV